jgi:hypothetical protein
MSPPYVGIPSLSHQFPVLAVEVTVCVIGCAVVVVVAALLVVLVVEVAEVIMDVEVVLDLLQDASTKDVAIRKVNAIQIILLFISSSYPLTETYSKLTMISFWTSLLMFSSNR